MPSPPQLQILRAYAKLNDASLTTTLPPTVYFSHTRHTLTIFDAYPKALFHFLILPRLRTRAPRTPGDGGERDRDSEKDVVADRAEDLTNLRTLLRCADTDSDTDP